MAPLDCGTDDDFIPETQTRVDHTLALSFLHLPPDSLKTALKVNILTIQIIITSTVMVLALVFLY